jgi:hypothetical protein
MEESEQESVRTQNKWLTCSPAMKRASFSSLSTSSGWAPRRRMLALDSANRALTSPSSFSTPRSAAQNCPPPKALELLLRDASAGRGATTGLRR